MLTIAGGLLVLPLGIGIWRFGTSDAPIMAGPLGPVVWVILLLGLGVCVLGIFQVIMNTAFLYHSVWLCVSPSQFTLGNGMEEVVGSIPPDPLNHSTIQLAPAFDGAGYVAIVVSL